MIIKIMEPPNKDESKSDSTGSKICRCCLDTEKPMESAYESHYHFKELAGINVTVSDGMPWICVDCRVLLRRAVAFKYEMLRSQRVLQCNYVKGACLDSVDPVEISKYNTSHLMTTHTLTFDSTHNCKGFHEVLQQDKKLSQSDEMTLCSNKPALPLFESTCAFEGGDSALFDLENDPLDQLKSEGEDETNKITDDGEYDDDDEGGDDDDDDEDDDDDNDAEMSDLESSQDEVISQPERKVRRKLPPVTKIDYDSDGDQALAPMIPHISWTSESDKTLIEFVRCNEALYNPKSKLYKIAVLKKKLWIDIGTILDKSDTDCYKRWCYVRDYYIRRRHKMAAGGEAAKKRAQLLSFLDRVPTARGGWAPKPGGDRGGSDNKGEDNEWIETLPERPPSTESHNKTVKEEASTHDPWENIRIGEQYTKMSEPWTTAKEDVLIEFVSRNEALYNPRSKDYRRAQFKRKLWSDIASLLNKTDTECYKRWSYVRDYYIRRKSNPGALSTGKAAKRRAQLLAFLTLDSQTDEQEEQILKCELEQCAPSHALSADQSTRGAYSDNGQDDDDIRDDMYTREPNAWTIDTDEVLIDLVSAHQALYNPRCKEFRRPQLKRRLWRDIARELKTTDADCYKRWCYVRDYYIRRRGKVGVLSTGKAAKRRADKLAFLDHVSAHVSNEDKEPSPSHSDDTRERCESVGRVSWSGEEDATLIAFVRRHKALYDPTTRRGGRAKGSLWKEIAKTLDKTEASCNSRWNYVRDYYIRRRGKPCGEGAARRAALLVFLDRGGRRKRTSK